MKSFCCYLSFAAVAVAMLGMALVARGAISGVTLWPNGRAPQVACSGGIALERILDVPARNGLTPLFPGLAWVGRHRLAVAASGRKLLLWNLTHADAKLSTSLFKLDRRALIVRLFGNKNALRVLSLLSPKPNRPSVLEITSLSLRNINKQSISSFRLPPLAVPPEEHLYQPFVSAVIPASGGWLAAIPLPAAIGEGINILRMRTGRLVGPRIPLFEPWNAIFCSADGQWLAWVCGGHTLRVISVGKKTRVTRIDRLISQSLATGALSPHGRRALVMTSVRGPPGGPVRAILVRTADPLRERVMHLWGRLDPAVVQCRPHFTRSGALAAMAALKIRTPKWPVDIWIISTTDFTVRCCIRLRFEFPQDLVFSPNGSRLAVEGNYHVLIFRLPKAWPPAWESGRTSWQWSWTHPRTVRLR